MIIPNFGFHFETARRAPTQGAIAPAEQFFEGSIAEESLVRETGQNSIDARAGDAPVRMTFHLTTVATADIPGIEDLAARIGLVEAQTRGVQGHDRMQRAHDTVQRDSMPVLRISDAGTLGLTGSESLNHNTTPLSALTRGAGVSADDGQRGGSFGIGSAVGPMASDINTVLYTSRPHDNEEVVFAGYSRLASHRDEEGVWHIGDGVFTDLDVHDDFRYLRNPPPLPPFPSRTEPGTDLYVLGYRNAATDPGLQQIRRCFLDNFLLAIQRGELVVDGVTDHGTWRLDSETLPDQIRTDPQLTAFYRAIHDPDPIIKQSARLGTVKLYINIDDSLERTLHTVTVRRPLMRIDTFRHPSVPAKYAAILECSDQRGNRFLRQLEPPQHNTWDAGRAPGGAAALNELKTFVREGLKSRVKQRLGDQVEIKGLGRYLPSVTHENPTADEPGAGRPGPGPGTTTESSTVQGADAGEANPVATRGRSVRVGVNRPATGSGDDPTRRGRDAGGDGERTSRGGNQPGTGSPGEGSARIRAGDVRLRSWSDPTTSDIRLVVTADQDLTGDLELAPLGPGGDREDDYELPIAAATLDTPTGPVQVPLSGNTLTGLRLSAGVPHHIRLQLTTSGHRYRLGIK